MTARFNSKARDGVFGHRIMNAARQALSGDTLIVS